MCTRLQTLGRHFNVHTVKENSINVTVTGAAGNIGYALIMMIGQGRLFGPNQKVNLTLLEIPPAQKVLKGVVMELNDCAFPILSSIKGTTDLKEGFNNCQVAILVGARPRSKGMERKDLLGANAMIFKDQGKAINDYANADCKVCVVGNPANTNAMICQMYAPRIPKENFTALTRLDQTRAIHQIADKVKCNVEQVKNLIIWGNHSITQYPDINCGYISNYPQKDVNTPIRNAVNDNEWANNNFVTTVAKRGGAIIEARGASSAASAANAVCDHIHDWMVGTQHGEIVSMGVMSDGSYGIPKGINFSFPVTCVNGKWTIVQGLKWDDFSKKKIEATTKELCEEKEMAVAAVSK